MATELIGSILQRGKHFYEAVTQQVTSFSAGPLSFSRLDSILYRASQGKQFRLFAGIGAGMLAIGASILPRFSLVDAVSDQFLKNMPVLAAVPIGAAILGTALLGTLSPLNNYTFTTRENFDQKLAGLQKDIEHAVRYRYFQGNKAYFKDRIDKLFTDVRPNLITNPERAQNIKKFILGQDPDFPFNRNPREALRAFKIAQEMDELQDNAYKAKTVPLKRQMDKEHEKLLREFQTLPQEIRNLFPCTFFRFVNCRLQFKETLEAALNYDAYAKDGWDFLERTLGRSVKNLPKPAIHKGVEDSCKALEQGYLGHGFTADAQTIPLLKKLIDQLDAVEKVTGVSTQKTALKIHAMIEEIQSQGANGVMPACFNRDILSYFLMDASEESSSLTDLMTLCSQQRGKWADAFVSRENMQKRIQKSPQHELKTFVDSVANCPNRSLLFKTFFRYASQQDQKRFLELLPHGLLGDVLASLPEDLAELDLSACAKSMKDHHLLCLAKRHFPELQKLNLFGCSALSENALKTFVSAPGSPLRILNLQGCRVTDAVVKALAENPSKSYLEKLDISDSVLSPQITNTSLEAIANSLYLWNLNSLALGGCAQITDQGIQHIAASKKMGRMKNLELIDCQSLTGASLRAIAASPYMAHLEYLAIAGSPLIDDAGVLAIANSPHMGSLKRLLLAKNPRLTNAAIQGIARSAPMRLEELNIVGCPLVGDPAIQAIAHSVSMRGLKALMISSPLITNLSAVSIANSENMSSLEGLALFGCPQITNTALISLANSPNMSEMKRLRVSDCPLLTNQSIQAVAGSNFMSNLEALNVGGCPALTDASAKAIAESEKMKNLKMLSFSRTRTSDIGVLALSKSPYMNNLEELHLESAPLTDAGIAALAKSEYLQRLQRLNLQGCNQLTNASPKSIAASPFMNAIAELIFSRCPLIREEGIKALAESPNMDNLRRLNISGAHWTLQSLVWFAQNQKNVVVQAQNVRFTALAAHWFNYAAGPFNGMVERTNPL